MRIPFFSQQDNRQQQQQPPLQHIDTSSSNTSIGSHSHHSVESTRPPTPEGNVDPILLPDEVILQIFPRKLCSYREEPPQKQGFFSYNEPEYFHSFLTRKARTGALWVTTMRLMFVPMTPAEKGFSISILDIEKMKTIESDMKIWFFFAHVGVVNDNPDNTKTFMFTIPFSTQLRTQAFLKLISNLLFEHKVRQALPPPYRRKSESFYDCPRPSIDSITVPCSPTLSDSGSAEEAIEEVIEGEEEDWQDNDRHLPSYMESEDAVERYLIERGLLNEDGTPLLPAESNIGNNTESVTPRHGEVDQDRSSSNVLRRTSTSSSSRPRLTRSLSRGGAAMRASHAASSTENDAHGFSSASEHELIRITSRASARSETMSESSNCSTQENTQSLDQIVNDVSTPEPRA
ncbi:hypothetical protein V1512DRAFT_248349 [Lipomyces arxii]|uniref:uncharacterized protein n=1 Tax=Lipomyces arxii TaxID=56418 RepID=UPI0034CE1199